MDTYIGIDVGTSGVKSILIDNDQTIIDQQTIPLPISRPHPLWSEQNPQDWWQATCESLDQIAARHPDAMARVRSIGLAGQMHGAVLLDNAGTVLRPAILWNDNRCQAESQWLQKELPEILSITGNLVMPGFTAPKLVWVRDHEPDIFARIAKVLLPKDYVRFCFSGAYVGDMSDSAGTLWLDVKKRAWSDDCLNACGLTRAQMPELCEGSDISATILPDLAKRWGMAADVTLAGGAGDNAAGAIGIGATRDNRSFISLGTSGVYFIGTNDFHAAPERTVHSFCHALPNTWHQMGVILSAASCVTAASKFLFDDDNPKTSGHFDLPDYDASGSAIFLPYLSGERTPHNDPHAKGVFWGLNHDTSRAEMAAAVLEGVAFAFVDCQDALAEAGSVASELGVIGGGARNKVWGQILASALNKPLTYYKDADQGPAFGAARLAQISLNRDNESVLLKQPETVGRVEPDAAFRDKLQKKLAIYREIYDGLRNVKGI